MDVQHPVAGLGQRLHHVDPGAGGVPQIDAQTGRRRLRRTGVAELDADGRIVRFWQKPAKPPADWACPALYVLEPEALAVIPRFLDEQPDADAPGAWIGWLVERQPVFAHEMRGRRLDIGDPESYQAAGTWIAQAGPGLRPLRGGTLTKT